MVKPGFQQANNLACCRLNVICSANDRRKRMEQFVPMYRKEKQKRHEMWRFYSASAQHLVL